MRKIAEIRENAPYRRVMIYDSPEGAYLFLFKTVEDGPCAHDELYKTLPNAEAACEARFGILSTDWRLIEDPRPGCQHDWIRPTRAKVDTSGRKIPGEFEPSE